MEVVSMADYKARKLSERIAEALIEQEVSYRALMYFATEINLRQQDKERVLSTLPAIGESND